MGHVAGHHALAGAAVGCVVGRHQAKVRQSGRTRPRRGRSQALPDQAARIPCTDEMTCWAWRARAIRCVRHDFLTAWHRPAGSGAARDNSAMIFGSPGTVAQLVEQGPFKALVLGSSPSRPTNKINSLFPCGAFEKTAMLKHLDGYVSDGRLSSADAGPADPRHN